ncbi:hypothetical protein [Microtetraspora malaysiensis]|uniref:hypothetical protein n=1 Tax=Microtetraspora malaysiensis TaxID=161358 RepID=UPI003D8D072A
MVQRWELHAPAAAPDSSPDSSPDAARRAALADGDAGSASPASRTGHSSSGGAEACDQQSCETGQDGA